MAAQDDKPTFRKLLDITVDALKMWPPSYIRSVLGPVSTWLPPQNPYSEFTMLDPWRLSRALKYIVDVTVPSVSAAPPAFLAMLLPPVLEDLFFVQTEVLHRPDYYDDYTSFPKEKWFFINGILTNGDVAQLNAACISYLFHRPVTLVQNATDGALADLYECALGKEWYRSTSNTEAARIAFPAIYDALKDHDKKKVVVICHSQGTIIMADVLSALEMLPAAKAGSVQGTAAAAVARDMFGEARPVHVVLDDMYLDPDDFEPLQEDEWAKLEIYFFATCANVIRHHQSSARGWPVPWMEHFGNERDIVARLGMLANKEKVHIEGAHFVRPAALGHLLNIDYLLPLMEDQKRGRKRGGRGDATPFKLTRAEPNGYAYRKVPRLYDYLNGGSPKENAPREDLKHLNRVVDKLGVEAPSLD